MAPHSPSTIVFRKNCYDSKIPFATWSHGGYGLTHSLAGYDVTILKDGKMYTKTHITNDVITRLTATEVTEVMKKVQNQMY